MPDLTPLKNLMNDHERGGDFERDWALANRTVGAPRSRTAWLIPLLAAAAVVTWLGAGLWTAEKTPEEPETSAAAGRAEDGRLEVGVGHAAFLQLDRTPISIALVDDSVAQIQSVGEANRFMLEGIAKGRTDILVSYGDKDEIRTVNVVDRPVSHDSVGWVDVPVGGHMPWTGPTLTAVAIVDPSILSANGTQKGVTFSGLKAGTTDVLMTHSSGIDVYSVRVGKGSRALEWLAAPATQPVTLEVGQAHRYPAPSMDILSVNIIDPTVIEATPMGKSIVFKAMAAGVTDVVVEHKSGQTGRMRVTVKP